HRLEVALHAVDANRNAIDERERLRVLGENRCEHAWDDVAKSSVSWTLASQKPTYGPCGCAWFNFRVIQQSLPATESLHQKTDYSVIWPSQGGASIVRACRDVCAGRASI